MLPSRGGRHGILSRKAACLAARLDRGWEAADGHRAVRSRHDARSSVVCLPVSPWSLLARSPSVAPFLRPAEWFPGTQVHLFRQAGLHGTSLSLVLAFHDSWEHLLLEEKAFFFFFF